MNFTHRDGELSTISTKINEVTKKRPLENPLLTNTVEHTHSVVHQGDKERIAILIYGEM